MKRALLLISPALLIDLFKGNGPRMFDVINFALPEDARFADVRYINSEGVIAIEVESETFPDMPPKAKHPVELSTPVCRVVSEDELLVRLAARQASEVPRAPDSVEVETEK